MQKKKIEKKNDDNYNNNKLFERFENHYCKKIKQLSQTHALQKFSELRKT